jgi:hypothetical protein
MRRAVTLTAVFLFSIALCGQQQPAQPAPPSQQPAPSVWIGQGAPGAQPQSTVAPNQPVITIKGVCNGLLTDNAGVAGACETQITREQFEKLLAAVNSNNQPVTPEMRRTLGQGLAELLVWADAATKAGVEKEPAFQDMMRIVRVRTLRDFYLRKLEEQARNVSPQDVQNFYNQNIGRYQEMKLQRVLVPGSSPGGPGDTSLYQKAQQLATTLQQRAAAGEDLNVLQKDAYSQLGIVTPPPSVDMGVRRPGMLTPEQDKEVGGLEAGQVSKVFPVTSGFIIFKVVSKQAEPFDQVKERVTRDLIRSRLEARAKEVNGTAKPDLNEQYFGAAAAPASAPAPTLGPPR